MPSASKPEHTVGELTTIELRDLGAKLERSLEWPHPEAERQFLTDPLEQVTAEQDKRAGHPEPARTCKEEVMTSDAFAASDPRAYIQLAAAVAKEITAGNYTPGDQLPSIKTLCTDSGLSRQTAGKALRLLERRGLIDRYPGLGYFVRGQETPGEPAAPGAGS